VDTGKFRGSSQNSVFCGKLSSTSDDADDDDDDADIVCTVGGSVLEIPFNMTVQTRGLLEADSEMLASESMLHSSAVNHSRTLRCADEVLSHSLY